MDYESKRHVLHKACEKIVATMDQSMRSETLDSTGIQRLQLMAKTLKDLSITEAMWQEQEGGYSGRSYAMDQEMGGGYSGRRMRSARTGRWYSGDGSGGNSMDGGGNSMDGGGNSYGGYSGGNSYGGDNQQMIAQMEQMLRQMKQNQ